MFDILTQRREREGPAYTHNPRPSCAYCKHRNVGRRVCAWNTGVNFSWKSGFLSVSDSSRTGMLFLRRLYVSLFSRQHYNFICATTLDHHERPVEIVCAIYCVGIRRSGQKKCPRAGFFYQKDENACFQYTLIGAPHYGTHHPGGRKHLNLTVF